MKETSSGEEPMDEYQLFLQTLPKVRNWDGTYLYFYQNFWCPSLVIQAVTTFQQHFQAKEGDTFIASTPKSGTTWMKCLAFTILNRHLWSVKQSPLLTTNPHELVPFIEHDLYLNNLSPNLESMHEPRLFSTHVPYESLPHSIKYSNCRIIYIHRNPLDLLVSYWHFSHKLRGGNGQPLTLEEAFEKFCEGVNSFGPHWDHVLGYWKESLKRPDKVLFLRYEDLTEDTIVNLKRLASFLGVPFSVEEEREGKIDEISRLCSFNNMKELEVNKAGKRPAGVDNSAFFRKAEVGDWTNYLTHSMAEQLENLVQEKFAGSGFPFKRISSCKNV